MPSPISSVSQNDQIALEEKNLKKAEKCQKALQGTSIGLSSLGVITLLATAIILMAAPLLLPVIAFKALLLSGAAILILGTALAVAAIAKSCKKISPQEQKLQNDLNDSIAQQTALSGQVRQSETQRNQIATEKQEIERKLQEAQTKLEEKNLELATAQSTLQKLQDEKDPQGFQPKFEQEEAKNKILVADLDQMTQQKTHFEAQLTTETNEKNQLNQKLNETGDELARVRQACDTAQQQNAVDEEAIKGLKEEVTKLKQEETRLLQENQRLDGDNQKFLNQELADKDEIERLKEEKKTESGKLQREITGLKEDIDDLNDEIAALEKEKTLSSEAFDKLEKEVKLLNQQLEETKKQHLEKLKEFSTELSQKESDLQAAEIAKTNATRELNEATLKWEKKEDLLNKDYDALENDYHYIRKEKEKLKGDFDAQAEVLQSSLEKNEKLVEENERLKTTSGRNSPPQQHSSPMSQHTTKRRTSPNTIDLGESVIIETKDKRSSSGGKTLPLTTNRKNSPPKTNDNATNEVDKT